METNKIYFISAVRNKRMVNGHARVLGIQDNLFDGEKEYFLHFAIHGEYLLKEKEIKEVSEGDEESWKYESSLES